MSSTIIEVVIGLVLVYSLLSLLVSQINNLIVNLLNVRAEHLRVELEKLIADPRLRDQFLSHPMIRVAQEEVARTLRQRLRNLRTGLARWLGLLPRLENPALRTSDVTWITPDAFVQTMLGLMEMTDDARVQRAVHALETTASPNAFQRTMKEVLATAQTVQDVRERLTTWFNAFETQLTDLYKRNVQRFLLLIGMLLAVLLNIDSLYLAETLWNDPALRQAVAATAEETLQAFDQAESDTAQPDTQDPLGQVRQSAEEAQTTINILLDLRLPIGWVYVMPDEAAASLSLIDPHLNPRNVWNLSPLNNPGWLGLWLRKLVGWFLTGVAVMQGADFWFNLLRQLTGGGKK